MLYCNRCGQCKHIDDDMFVEITRISGTEVRYLDPVTGDVVDYGDTDTESSGESDYECPNCNSSDIEFDVEPTTEEAFNQRAEYEKQRKERQRIRNLSIAAELIKESDWDLVTNEAHAV